MRLLWSQPSMSNVVLHAWTVFPHYTKQNRCFSPCHANCNELICCKTLFKPSQLNVISFLFLCQNYAIIIPQIDSRDWSTVTTEVTIMRWECTEATRYSFRLAVHMTKKEQCLFSACV